MGVRSLHHIAIRVRDPETSRRFYEDVLGFRFMEIPVSGAMITEWEDAPAEGKLLATQAGDTFVILEPPLQGTGPDDRFDERRIGVDHLAFGVEGREDLERLEARSGTPAWTRPGSSTILFSTRTTSRSAIQTTCSGSST
jgi:catechol 2,3-dioxygenase-like lactoylglutathione lyase family enzyme